MLNATLDSLSNLGILDVSKNGEDKEDGNNTELDKVSKYNDPGWVMGRLSNMVQHRIECCWQKLIRRDKLTQPCRGDTAEYFCERDKKYGIAKLMIPAVSC